MFVLVCNKIKHMDQDTHVCGTTLIGPFDTREQAEDERNRILPLIYQVPYIITTEIDIEEIISVDKVVIDEL